MSFVEDVAYLGPFDGATADIGLAATLTDETLAAQRVTTLLTAIRFGAAAGAVPATVTDSTVDG